MTHMPEVRLALILMRALDDVKNDPEKLRSAIYSLARLKVGQEMSERDPAEAARIFSALEVAIGEVEGFSTDEPLLLANLTGNGKPAPQPAPTSEEDAPADKARPSEAAPTAAEAVLHDPPGPVAPSVAEELTAEEPATLANEAPVAEANEIVEPMEVEDVAYTAQPVAAVETADVRPLRSPTVIIRPMPLPPLAPAYNDSYYQDYAPRNDRRRETLTLIVPVIAVFSFCVIFAGGLIWETRQWSRVAVIGDSGPGKPALAASAGAPVPVAAAQIAPQPALPPPPPPAPTYPFPLPKSYGVFAIVDDKLAQLPALPGRVADPRIAISAEITRPVGATLSTGKLSFIVYRRDAAITGADYVDVRAIANIRDHMSFDGGKAAIAQAGDVWAMRNVAYRLTITPVEGQPDMFLLRPQDENFVFSPGRYGLVLNHQAYDFEVSGLVVDPVHCLEKVVAVNGSFYSPCASPAANTPNKKADPAAPAPKKSEAARAKKKLPPTE